MAVYYGTNASSGAPALSGTNGTLVAVLDFWLVTTGGYTLLATSGNERIYQSPAGTGYCLYVGDSSTISGDARKATVRGCEPTSTLGALVNQFPRTADESDSDSSWQKSSVADSTAVDYLIVVSDGLGPTPPFVKLTVNTVGSTQQETQVWCDGDPMDASDPYCNLLSIHNGLTANLSWSAGIGGAASLMSTTGAPSNNLTRLYAARNRDGTVVGPLEFIVAPGTGNVGNWNSHAAYPHPDTGGLHHEYCVIGCRASNSSTPGAKAISKRAILPVIRNFLHVNDYTGLANLQTWEDTQHDAGAQFMALISGTTGCAFGVEITDTYKSPGVG